MIDVLVLSPTRAASDISTTSERRLEVLGRCIPMLARGLSMHGGCVLRHVLPIKIGFWNPGLSKGGVVSGMGWSCGVLRRTSLEVPVASGRVFVVYTLSPLAQYLCSLSRTGQDGF